MLLTFTLAVLNIITLLLVIYLKRTQPPEPHKIPTTIITPTTTIGAQSKRRASSPPIISTTKKPCRDCTCSLLIEQKNTAENKAIAPPSSSLSSLSEKTQVKDNNSNLTTPIPHPLSSSPTHPSRNDPQYQQFIHKDDPPYIDYIIVRQKARIKPRMPDDDACCGTGCERCVFDIYDDNLMKWESRRDDAVKEQIKEHEQMIGNEMSLG